MGQFNTAYMTKRWGSQALSSSMLKRDAAAETADQTEYIEVNYSPYFDKSLIFV